MIVDLLQQYGFEYVAINPGASFRGLHDSLINYGDNIPEMRLPKTLSALEIPGR